MLSQPRRLALLLYVALEGRGAFLRRDRLLGVFWPESSEDRARAALRQAVLFLRRHLGQGVLVGRTSEELGIPAGTLYCDALDFRRALDAGRDEEALALHGGELLPGFFVSDAPEFEGWLERDRAWYRRSAREAALRLADASSGEEAIEWLRRSMEIDPLDEAVARRLIEALDGVGNRAAAVATFDAFRERLKRELDLEPSPETVALAGSVRERATRAGATPAGDRVHAPARDPRRIVVTAFENETGDPELDALGRMAADWVARGLAEIPDLDVVPPLVALGHRARAGERRDALDDARDAADRTGAGTVVSGAYYLVGSEIQFHPRIVDAAGRRMLRSPEPIAAPRAAPISGVEALRERVAASLAPLLGSRESHLRSGGQPPSYEAYRSYMDGLERFVAGDWRGALPHFRRSADLEATFVLPRIVCAIAHWNLCELAEAKRVVDETLAFRDAVGPFERAVLDMVTAWLHGDWAAARDAALRQAELAPGSIPHFQVAEEARRLNRPREAVDVLSRLDPARGELRGWIFYWVELATAHHLLGEHAAELAAAREARAAHPHDPRALLLEVRALAALGDVDGVRSRLDESLASPSRTEPRPGALMHEAALELAAHGAPEDAAELFERSVAWYRSRPAEGEAAGEGHRRALARALYHGGRWGEAEALFGDLEKGGIADPCSIAFHHGHLQGHLDEGYLAVLAQRRGDDDEVTRRCRDLEGLDRPFAYGSRHLWLAAVAALRGERDRAVASLRRAFAEGLPLEMFVHTEPHLLALRGHVPFDVLLRPRG